MRKTLTLLAVVITAFACTKQTPADDFDVRLDIPSEMVLDHDATTLRFGVRDGKAPKGTDVLLLTGSGPQRVCSFTSLTASYAVIARPADLTEGSYSVSVQRGAKVLAQGTMRLVLRKDDDGVRPAAGSTVYGKVSCAGKGVPGVPVSDGFDVVVTDADGVYQLSSAKYHKYVFISTPSGYGTRGNGVLPALHKPLSLRPEAAERVDFELVRVNGQEKHTMLIFGDMHLADRIEDRAQFAHFVDDVNGYVSSLSGEIVYGLTLGDMTWDQFWLTNSYGFKEYLGDISRLRGLTLFHTIGNHDHSMYYAGDYDTVVEYKALVAPTYYSYNIGKVHYIVLDDIECTNTGEGTSDSRSYKSNVVQAQIDWLRKDLALVPKDTPLLLTMHAPMYENPGTSRGNSAFNLSVGTATQLESLLKEYPEVHIFTAHTHKVYNVDNLGSNRIFEHNAGAVCATWWWTAHETPGIHIAQDGVPGGYTILKVDGTTFSWQFKATTQPLDVQFRTYDRNQIALSADQWIPNASQENAAKFNTYNALWRNESSDNYVYISVWNYDASWSVSVSENGTPLSVTRVGAATDPLHLLAYMVPRLAKNNSISFPTAQQNYHLFRVQASSPSSTLLIKVTDRFGNEYTETMTRPRPFTVAEYTIQDLL